MAYPIPVQLKIATVIVLLIAITNREMQDSIITPTSTTTTALAHVKGIVYACLQVKLQYQYLVY